MERSRPRRSLRTCLLAVSLPVLAAVFGVSATAFAAETSSVTAMATASKGVSVLTFSNGARLPQGIETLRHTKAIDAEGRIETLRQPSWSPIPGAVGEVDQPGDLYIVDVRDASAPVYVTLHVTNLGALAKAYSTLLLPVGIWRATDTGSWVPATTEPHYLTHSDGNVEVRLDPGTVYELTLEVGGTWAAAPATARDYALKFFVTSR